MEKISPGKYLYVNQQNHPFLGMLIILFLFLFSMLILNFYNIVSFSQVYPAFLGWLPHVPVSTTATTKISSNVNSENTPFVSQSPSELETCQVKQWGNSLIKSDQIVNNNNHKVLTGSFFGIITVINENKTDNIFSINLKSLNGEQNHLFNLSPKNTPLVAGSNKKQSYSSLKKGDIITLDFTCDMKTNNFNIYKAEFPGMATRK